MATFRLATILITSTVDPSFINGDEVNVLWNDVTEAISVTLNGGAFSTAGSTLGIIGDNYQIIIGASSSDDTYVTAGYSFCDATSLNWFRMLRIFPEYPFFEKVVTADSPVCAAGGGVVCDIQFTGSPTITHATDITTGGSVTVVATSSNGTVKYGLRNNAYADLSNTSGTFTGLPPGTWTIYAKDPNDCTAIKTVKILFKPTESEHYRFTWTSKKAQNGTTRDARVRIYEREYFGDVVELEKFEVSPFSLMKRKQGELNDKFYPIHPTSALLRLKSLKNYQYLPLFTQDNKRYKVVYEVDEGAGFAPVWSGFIVPAVYREKFVATPYTVEVEVVDNVKRLEQEPFADDDGNLLFGDVKVIKVIALIMKKTGLTLNIRSGINIFETNHTTAATDDPLDQTYVDVTCYRKGKDPFDCWRVLESILRPFGARIFQYDNSWIIEEIDRAVATYAYRVFTSEGVYSSNSTFNPIIDVKSPSLTTRAAYIEKDHSLEVIPAYGKIDIVSKLNYIGSIVAGGFEKEDLLSPEAETFSQSQGIFTSEEGFKDWTLRLNGIDGVSFGRVVVGNRGDSARTGLQGEEDITRSVGAFSYDPNNGTVLGWSGNLRDAYIESAAKPYQYGPGDEINFRFEYSTPARSEYEFMILRFLIKIGSNYLQPDGTWGVSESIYRAYPPVTNSLQRFEFGVPVPETDVVVDSTIQIRIYFYAPYFYDYGLPTSTSDPADGTDGLAGLDTLVTVGVDYDYRLDLRREFTVGSFAAFFREFYELRVSDAAEDVNNGIVRAGDFNATTNPKIWYGLKSINIKDDETNNRRRGADRKFYLDNVALDALINGQPPPEEETISLTVSKYINENLEIELYNFDVPDIVNAKNMYNNYFRLSNGTPTALWARSGVAEALTLQEILLKVLGGNHSAPTFRMTGSFINEFARIGINNYLKIVKSGSSLTASNTTFTSNLTGWSQVGTGETWTWTADNSGSAEVTLNGAEDSKKIYQAITHSGGYIEFTVNVKAIPTLSTNDSEDQLIVVFFNGSNIIHTERMQTFAAVTSESDYNFTYTAFAPGDVTHIGFYIRRVTGTGEVNYQVGEFTPAGTDITEIYQITDYTQEERMNTYSFELMQVSKTYVSLANIDTGGNNQSGGTSGREHSSAYSTAYS